MFYLFLLSWSYYWTFSFYYLLPVIKLSPVSTTRFCLKFELSLLIYTRSSVTTILISSSYFEDYDPYDNKSDSIPSSFEGSTKMLFELKVLGKNLISFDTYLMRLADDADWLSLAICIDFNTSLASWEFVFTIFVS